MKLIDNNLLAKISVEAVASTRKRKNYNFHEELSDPVNRMLNALEPGTYIRPHRHESHAKREVFIILSGRVAVIFFDGTGQVIEVVVLDRAKGVHGVEIAPGEWHTIVSLDHSSVVYEVKDGPYSPLDDKDFAHWAPGEGCREAVDYLEVLENIVNRKTVEPSPGS